MCAGPTVGEIEGVFQCAVYPHLPRCAVPDFTCVHHICVWKAEMLFPTADVSLRLLSVRFTGRSITGSLYDEH
jgi:hypothetical protein